MGGGDDDIENGHKNTDFDGWNDELTQIEIYDILPENEMLDDVEILLNFVLDYGSKGLLPNMDEGGSGDIAYEATCG